jgi:hypothetical protein
MGLFILRIILSLIICKSANPADCSINPVLYSTSFFLSLYSPGKPFYLSLCQPLPVEEELVLKALVKEDGNVVKDCGQLRPLATKPNHHTVKA